MDPTREIIVRLLGSIGSQREVEEYLKQYASIEKRKFAVVKIGGALLDAELDELASSLTFLQRVGLYPIVIHGAGPQLNAALDEAGIQTERIDGLRVTRADTLEIARTVFLDLNLRLVDHLETMGTRARPVTSGVFQASLLDEEKFGYVGEVDKVNLDPIGKAIRAGCLPILTCLGETPTGQIVNINADTAARELCIAIEPHKIVFLSDTGGLLDEHGRVINSINLTEDFEELMSQEWVHSGMRLKLQEISLLLERLPLASSVAISRPQDLPRELFTHRGAGTFIQRGERVLEYTNFDDIDREKMRDLLESGFGRALTADYFDQKTPERIFATESYRAAAIITDEGNVPYLDKFAVTPQSQGEGLGASVWNRVKHAYPRLYWRSRTANPINSWYFHNAQGSYATKEWVVFWYGLGDNFEVMRDCVQHALAIPSTMLNP